MPGFAAFHVGLADSAGPPPVGSEPLPAEEPPE